MSQQPPHLIVDPGPETAPGRAVHLQFHVNAEGFLGSPTVSIRSATLKPQHWDESPSVHWLGPGCHEFHLNPVLSDAAGREVAAGSYLVEVEVEFPQMPQQQVMRFLRCAFRLEVPPRSVGGGRTLRIEAADAAIVDLKGLHQVTGDAEIVVGKGGLVKLAGAGTAPTAGPSRVVRLPLHPNHHRLSQTPFRSQIVEPTWRGDSLLLRQPGDRRTLLFARNELRLGARDRGRDDTPNDLFLGLFPFEGANQRNWEQISSCHCRLVLRREGLAIHDAESKNGTWYRGQPVTPATPATCTVEAPGGLLQIANVLSCQIDLQALQPNDERALGPVYAAALGLSGHLPLWLLGEQARIDSARLRRVNNHPQEEYVLLFRQAVLGPGDWAAVQLPQDDGRDELARVFHAAGCFWLERLTWDLPVRVGSHEPQLRELVPLKPGDRLQLGSNSVEVAECQQYRGN